MLNSYKYLLEPGCFRCEYVWDYVCDFAPCHIWIITFNENIIKGYIGHVRLFGKTRSRFGPWITPVSFPLWTQFRKLDYFGGGLTHYIHDSLEIRCTCSHFDTSLAFRVPILQNMVPTLFDIFWVFSETILITYRCYDMLGPTLIFVLRPSWIITWYLLTRPAQNTTQPGSLSHRGPGVAVHQNESYVHYFLPFSFCKLWVWTTFIFHPLWWNLWKLTWHLTG